MPPCTDPDLARARLAYISAGHRPLSGPRRALTDEDVPLASQLESLLAEHSSLEDQAPSLPEVGSDEPGASRAAQLVALGRQHALAIFVLLLSAVGIAMVVLGQTTATTVPVQAASRSAPIPVSPPAPAPSSPPVQLRVHVLGAVAKPGVVTLPEGAIVQDAITAAGGLAAGANPGELNLAAPVADGQQVIVGTQAAPRGELKQPEGQPASQGNGSPGAKLALNTASQAQLEELPGVGPVTAAAIVAWREEHGGFTSVAELQEVDGIGPKSFAKLEPLVEV